MHNKTRRFLDPFVVIGSGHKAVKIARTSRKHRIDVFLISDKREPRCYTIC